MTVTAFLQRVCVVLCPENVMKFLNVLVQKIYCSQACPLDGAINGADSGHLESSADISSALALVMSAPARGVVSGGQYAAVKPRRTRQGHGGVRTYQSMHC